jgi:penicillin-binding protein A
VGFAPADKPVVALSALVVNPEKWRIKSSFVARDALEYWLPRARCASNGRGAEAGADARRRCAKTRRN